MTSGSVILINNKEKTVLLLADNAPCHKFLNLMCGWSPCHQILPAFYKIWILESAKVSRHSAEAIKLGRLCNMLPTINQLTFLKGFHTFNKTCLT
jgi:hypothetical protein